MHGGAKSERRVGVHGVVAFVDQADDSLLINNDVRPESPLIILVLDAIRFQDAVNLKHFVIHVAQQRKVEAVLLGKGSICRRTVEAHAEDFGVSGGDAAGINAGLNGAHLLRAAFGKREDVNGKENIFLAAIVAELDGLPLVGKKSEIGRGIANFERHSSDLSLLNVVSEGRSRDRGDQQKTYDEGTFHKHSGQTSISGRPVIVPPLVE